MSDDRNPLLWAAVYCAGAVVFLVTFTVAPLTGTQPVMVGPRETVEVVATPADRLLGVLLASVMLYLAHREIRRARQRGER